MVPDETGVAEAVVTDVPAVMLWQWPTTCVGALAELEKIEAVNPWACRLDKILEASEGSIVRTSLGSVVENAGGGKVTVTVTTSTSLDCADVAEEGVAGADVFIEDVVIVGNARVPAPSMNGLCSPAD